MPKVFDTDIVETAATLGPGTYTLLGAVTIGYRTFDEGFDTGDTPYYVVRNAADTKYEHNRGGTFTSGSNTLSRGVYLSSNGNAPVSWVSGDHPLLIYQPSATEILEDSVQGFRAATRSVWLQSGSWWRSAFPSSGKDTLMFYDGAVDAPLAEVEGGTGFYHNAPPGQYIDVAYAVTAGVEPSGTLICDGAAVSRTTYSKLFAKLSTSHGAGNGTTTFNKPDCRGRNRVGRDNQGGTTAGVIDLTYYGASVTANGTKGGFKGHTGGIGVSATSGPVGVFVTVSGSVNGASNNHNPGAGVTSAGFGDPIIGTGSGNTAAITVGGATSAFTILQPGIIVDTLIATGGQ